MVTRGEALRSGTQVLSAWLISLPLTLVLCVCIRIVGFTWTEVLVVIGWRLPRLLGTCGVSFTYHR